MDFTHLQRKGWSQKEIEHAKHALMEAESRKHKTIHLHESINGWLLAAVLVLAVLCFTLLIFPLLLFGPLALSIPIMFLLGLLLGMLAVHSFAHVGNTEHVGTFILASLLLQVWIIAVLEDRFKVIPALQHHSAWLFVIPFGIGIILASWRSYGFT